VHRSQKRLYDRMEKVFTDLLLLDLEENE
jgi:hypothetical protein